MTGRTPEETILEFRNRHSQAAHTVIFAPSLTWSAEMFQRPQQLARALAKNGALVFYLQPHVWPPVFTEIEERLIVCQIPADAFHVLPDAFVYTLTWSIPSLAYFLSPRVIYDYLDDLSVFEGNPRRIRRNHRTCIREADIVIATAERLFYDVKSLRPDVMLVPNGADYDHFSREPQQDAPADLKPILKAGKPIIGYHGALARWFDYELMKSIARERRDLSFVLLGADYDQSLQASGLVEEPNIHWLGAKPYRLLPAYVSRFDAGCIPFVVNQITNATSPIKLFEYFAAGKPVIVSPMEECLRYPQVLAAGAKMEWLQQIDRALQTSKDVREQRILQQTAQQNTWEKRAGEILKLMDEARRRPRRTPWYMRLKPEDARSQRFFRLVVRIMRIWRVSGARAILNIVFQKVYARVARLRLSLHPRIPRALDDTYIPEDNSQVILFSDREDVFPDYWPRSPLTFEDAVSPRPAVALVSTCKNEGANAAEWIAHLAAQTLKPNEIIIVDAGSSDGTLDILEMAAKKHNLPIKTLSKPAANIAAARNIAIQEAKSPVIASLDFGCAAHADWLDKLTRPFWLDPKIEVSAGWYRVVNDEGNLSRFHRWLSPQEVLPQHFVPSSRSLAFTKDAWSKAGGYPEWLTLTGEDTYFALELKRFCAHWAFTPEAIVDWRVPNSWAQALKKAFYYSTGDGETGYNAWLFRTILRKTLKDALGVGIAVGSLAFLAWLGWRGGAFGLWVFIGVMAALIAGSVIASLKRGGHPYFLPFAFVWRVAQTLGFLVGAKRKAGAVLRKIKGSKGAFFILAGVPIDDSGGGARCTQIALELLRQGYWVVYINRFPKSEAQDVRVKFGHPNLLLYEFERFSWDNFARQYEPLLDSLPVYALIEFPLDDFLPLIFAIRYKGGRIIYEMIDDWNTSLGGNWYTPEKEKQIIDASDFLIGTAPLLRDKLRETSRRRVELLPNAVNSRLFNPERLYRRPDDLPQAEWTAAYIGALWGDWFDWDLLIALARRYSQASIAVIGDYRDQCPDPPDNLRFLGLKPQTALPAYLAHIDVAIIPWKVNKITQATSPLKVYEYLAMHRPVVSPDINPLRDIPGVFLARDSEDFMRLVDDVRKRQLPREEIDSFIHGNNWQARVAQLSQWLKETGQ